MPDVEPVVTRRRSQAERRAATRGALLDATLDVLVEVGYSGLTTSHVVARAGVSRGAQAHYFATKADLVVQALEHLTGRLVAELVAQPARRAADPRRQYELLLTQLWELHSGPAATALIELLVAARTDGDLRTCLVRFDRHVATTLREAAAAVAPGLAERPEFHALVVAALSTIRGLTLLRPLADERQVRRLWAAARAQLVAGAGLEE